MQTPDPAEVEHINQLVRQAEASYRSRDFVQAQSLCGSVLKREPENKAALIILSYVAQATNNTALAIETLQKLVKLDPSSQIHYILATVYLRQNQPGEAEPHLQTAVEQPNPPMEALVTLADLRQQSGRFAEAEPLYKRAIEMAPNAGVLYFKLARNRKLTQQDLPFILRMEEVANLESLPREGARLIQYSMGKAYDDLGDYESAMKHYDLANALSYDLFSKNNPFPKELHRTTFDNTIATYTKAFLQENLTDNQNPAPIFVVGMPRSGTTLVEHILSCHPDVQAGEELSFWLSKPVVEENHALMNGFVNKKNELQIIENYSSLLRRIAGTKNRVTDKAPNNYMILGFIHMLFPKAKIIHVSRDPTDNALSLYTTPFDSPPNFAHSKENIAFAFSEYRRLMEHWRQVLPAENFYEIEYEALVSEPEGTIRNLIEDCGLDWNEKCLSPQTNNRLVTTPSVWQVHQPIYKSSVQRWKNYEQWLGPLLMKS